jgi:hypothetical protein
MIINEPKCPTCKGVLDCDLPAAHKKNTPSEGDVAVCLHCGEFLVFENVPFVKQMEFIEEMRIDDVTLVAMKRIRMRVLQKRMQEELLKDLIDKSGV